MCNTIFILRVEGCITTSSSTCLRIEIISIDPEMAAKGNSLLDSGSAHDLKTDTVEEPKGALIRYELSTRGCTMNFLGHPNDGLLDFGYGL